MQWGRLLKVKEGERELTREQENSGSRDGGNGRRRKSTDRQATDRQTGRPTDRHTDSQGNQPSSGNCHTAPERGKVSFHCSFLFFFFFGPCLFCLSVFPSLSLSLSSYSSSSFLTFYFFIYCLPYTTATFIHPHCPPLSPP